MTLFWHNAGLCIRYKRDAFNEWIEISDLNPEKEIHFQMTPIDLLRLGFRCIWAACIPHYEV